MIIARSPFRVSLFGGGSDYPAWYREHGGCVLGFTNDKYCYIQVRKLPPFFGYKHRIVYSNIEMVNSLDEIKHPSVRETFRFMPPHCGIELHHDGDLPARSGLGSSSAFTVGLLHAMRAMHGHQATKRSLAEQAIHIEQDMIKENVGSQDQVWAAFGGFNKISFKPDGQFDVSPIIMRSERREKLSDSLMLFFTGLSRNASDIAAKQIANIENGNAPLYRMQLMVRQAEEILHDDHVSINEIGRLLDESWRIKRELADNVTTPEIDEMYEAAKDAGALGGKLLGAGGGGFMLLFVPPENQPKVADRLKALTNVSFKMSTEGSKIVLYEPEGL